MIIKKWLNTSSKGLSVLLLSLLSLIFIGISSASASATPLVKCNYEGVSPLVCNNATATVSSINTGSPINGLASAYATWEGGITQKINFNTPLTVATSGFSVAFQLKRTSGPGSWWFSGGLRLNNNNLLLFSSQYPHYMLSNYDFETTHPTTTTYWVIGNYTPTTLTWYNNNDLWDTTYYRNNNWNYIDYSDDKPANFEFYSQNFPVLYDDFQVFDHILTESERQQLIDTGNITPPEPPTPPTGGYEYLLYYGDNPYYVGIGAANNLPVMYNVCDSWDEEKSHSIMLANPVDPTNELYNGSKKEITECSGLDNLNFDGPTEELTGYATINIIEEGDTNISLMESEPFLYTAYIGINTSDSWIKFMFTSPAYIQAGIESTVLTYGQFMAGGLADGKEICLINKDNNNSKILDSCKDATEGLSYQEAQIPVPDFQATKILSLGLFDKTSGELILESANMMIIIYDNSTMSEQYENQFGTSTLSYLGLSTRNLACTDDEWNSSEEFLGLNFTRALCSTKKFGLDIVFIIDSIIRKFLTGTGEILSNTFPFGIIKQINISWRASENATLPSDLSWLDQDNLSITIPGGWTGSATNSQVAIFGPDIFETGDETTAGFFQKLRSLSTYFIWAGFIFSIYFFGEHFYHEHLHKKEE